MNAPEIFWGFLVPLGFSLALVSAICCLDWPLFTQILDFLNFLNLSSGTGCNKSSALFTGFVILTLTLPNWEICLTCVGNRVLLAHAVSYCEKTGLALKKITKSSFHNIYLWIIVFLQMTFLFAFLNKTKTDSTLATHKQTSHKDHGKFFFANWTHCHSLLPTVVDHPVTSNLLLLKINKIKKSIPLLLKCMF